MTQKTMMIFIDGIGIGEAKSFNPFYELASPIFPFYDLESSTTLPWNGLIKPIDATLNVDGEPQSATGQTTLFTGVNASLFIGSHYPAFPPQELRQIIYEQNLFKKLNHSFCFANAYPQLSDSFSKQDIQLLADGSLQFSSHIPTRIRRHISVTTCMVLANHLLPFGTGELQSQTTIYHDFTNRSLIAKGFQLPLNSPIDAALILSRLLNSFDFVLYEFFLTDLFAHQKPYQEQLTLLDELAQFISNLAKASQSETNPYQLIITSDHGNIEDSRIRCHTRNNVPLMVWGKNSLNWLNSINSLTDVTPVLLKN